MVISHILQSRRLCLVFLCCFHIVISLCFFMWRSLYKVFIHTLYSKLTQYLYLHFVSWPCYVTSALNYPKKKSSALFSQKVSNTILISFSVTQTDASLAPHSSLFILLCYECEFFFIVRAGSTAARQPLLTLSNSDGDQQSYSYLFWFVPFKFWLLV